MSDWTTVRATVIDEYGIPDVAAQQVRVERAMCEALKVLRGLEFSFNRGVFSLTTVADQSDYDRARPSEVGTALLPYDFWGILGREIFNTSNAVQRQIRMVGGRRVRKLQNRQLGITASHPSRFTIEQQILKLYPTPGDTWALQGAYLQDLGTPVPFRSSSGVTYPIGRAWQFDNDGETQWVDLTTSLQNPTASAVQPFPSSPGEGDAFYVGWERKVDQPITINVSTAGVGAYTVTWNYWDSNSWVPLAGVTDNTNSFKTSGSNTLVFTVPDNWQSRGLNSTDEMFYLQAAHDAGAVSTDPELQQVTGIGSDEWQFYNVWKGGNRIVGATYSNDWFTRAFMVLVHAAAFQYLQGFANDPKRAEHALRLYNDSIQTLRASESALYPVGDVQPSLGYRLAGHY